MAVNACAQITGSFSSWGDCFLQSVFFGSPIVATIAIIGMVAFFAWKSNLPYEVSFMFAVGFTFMMALVFPSAEMDALVALISILLVGFLMKGIIKPAQR